MLIHQETECFEACVFNSLFDLSLFQGKFMTRSWEEGAAAPLSLPL